MNAEQTVTKLLCERQILKKKLFRSVTAPTHDLSLFLKNYIHEKNPYDDRFVFIK